MANPTSTFTLVGIRSHNFDATLFRIFCDLVGLVFFVVLISLEFVCHFLRRSFWQAVELQ